MLHLIEINATKLASSHFAIPGVAGTLDANVIQILQLRPGTYSVKTYIASETIWQFEVTAQGLVAYSRILDIGQGGFLTGRDSSNLGVAGFPITLDGTGLATRTYYLNGITNSLDRTKPQQLNLLPGRYQFFHGNGAVPEADFQVLMDGTVDFPPSSDAILKWHDASRTLEIVGFPITLDGTGLATSTYYLNGITNSLDRTIPQRLNLLPGRYQFFQGNGAVPEADFQVRMDGTVDFPSTSDAILKRRDTGRTLEIVGFPITLDGTGLATRTYYLNGITNSLDRTKQQPLNLLPGRYQFFHGNGAVPEADFEVRMDGTVDFPSSSDHILKRRDAGRTLELVGFPITLDGTGLPKWTYYLNGITNSLDSAKLQPLNLLPGRYEFFHGNSPVPEADFQVRMDGTVDYRPERDVRAIPPGLLSGRQSAVLSLVGFRVLVDARAHAHAGVNLLLMPFGTPVGTAAPQVVSLLPGTGLNLELATPLPKSASFDLAGSGRILLDEAYPFVDVRWQGWQQVVRLTTDEIRTLGQCCLDLAVDGG